MSKLFQPERHFGDWEKPDWSTSQAQAFNESVLTSAEELFLESGTLPVHELDKHPSVDSQTVSSDFYFGLGGYFWLLSMCKSQTRFDLAEKVDEHCDALLSEEEVAKLTSVFFGAPFYEYLRLVVETPKASVEKFLMSQEGVEENQFNEILYGAPGNLLATVELADRYPVDSLRNEVSRIYQAVADGWRYHRDYDTKLWIQTFDKETTWLGAAHGTAGNLQAMTAASKYVERSSDWSETLVDFFLKTATVEGPFANWHSAEHRKDYLIHWCHGAPGVLCALAEVLPSRPDVEDLLLKAGELVWQAGPLKKGPSLCHGTAGSALSLYKLFVRTGDEKWKLRGDQLLGFSLDQANQARQQYGQYRFSLFTGDLGLVWLNQCVEKGEFRFPFLDLPGGSPARRPPAH